MLQMVGYEPEHVSRSFEYLKIAFVVYVFKALVVQDYPAGPSFFVFGNQHVPRVWEHDLAVFVNCL